MQEAQYGALDFSEAQQQYKTGCVFFFTFSIASKTCGAVAAVCSPAVAGGASKSILFVPRMTVLWATNSSSVPYRGGSTSCTCWASSDGSS